MKKIIKNILVFISYFMYEYIAIALLNVFNINYNVLDTSMKVLFLFITNLVYITVLIFIYRNELKDDIKCWKTNYKTYIKKYVCLYMLGVILMGTCNIILTRITNIEISGNETAIRELIKKVPVYMAFSCVISSPIIEELIFRKSIKNIFKNKYAFIIISGFIFGILHISNYTDINEVLMGIPYIIMGIDFAYIYHKTNNIFTTITFHAIHNLLLLIINLM